MLEVPPQLLIFDLDGTLIDSAGDIADALNRMLAEIGGEKLSDAEVRSMVGDGAPTLVKRALAARPDVTIEFAEALSRFLAFYDAEPAARTRPFPGVPETLETLSGAGFTLMLCTNKPEGTSLKLLELLGLAHYFRRAVGGDTFPFRKPDPRMLTELTGPLGIEPGAALLIGDSEVDAATAKAAGVPFALMTYGYRRGPIDAIPRSATLDTFGELVALLGV